jgi:predicted short-subunit dehydrogenase-like oxidoreductase (DUF2520 family)
MKIVMVGAGNVATQMSLALKKSGFPPVQVYSRTSESASALANEIQCPFTTFVSEISDAADMYIISLKDSVLDAYVPLLVNQHHDAIFVHTSGSMPMSLFEGKAQHYGVLYPLMTLSKHRTVNFRKVPLFVEANDEVAYKTLDALACSLSDMVYRISSEQRRMLHLAAVFACNFSNSCYSMASQILKEANIPFDMILPLIEETAAKVHEMSPREAQTGPAIRYDRNVMDKHLRLLSAHPEMQDIYSLLSEYIHKTSI